jgi:hypothetical protein
VKVPGDDHIEAAAQAATAGLRHLVIVAPSKRRLYERLVHLFWGLETVEVIYDRRQTTAATPSQERRRRSTVDAELSAQGCAMVSSVVGERDRPPSDDAHPRH